MGQPFGSDAVIALFVPPASEPDDDFEGLKGVGSL
jgi:hypothetical protein